MLLLPAKVDEFLSRREKKATGLEQHKNYRERKTRKENRKSRFRFLQNIRKVKNRRFQIWARYCTIWT